MYINDCIIQSKINQVTGEGASIGYKRSILQMPNLRANSRASSVKNVYLSIQNCKGFYTYNLCDDVKKFRESGEISVRQD